MRPVTVAVATVLFSAVVLGGSKAGVIPPPAPPTEVVPIAADRAVPFRVGEVLTYDVGWSNFLTAAAVTLQVKERRTLGPGRAGYYVLAEGRPVGFVARLYQAYYKADAVLDTTTLLPHSAGYYQDQGGQIENHFTRFLSRTSIEYQLLTTPDQKLRRAVPASTLDGLSALYVLRTQPLKAGQTIAMPIAENGNLLQLRAVVAGPELVTSGLGTLPAWRLTPVLIDEAGQPVTDRDLTVWISNDAQRLPVQMRAGLALGSFTLTLARAEGTRK